MHRPAGIVERFWPADVTIKSRLLKIIVTLKLWVCRFRSDLCSVYGEEDRAIQRNRADVPLNIAEQLISLHSGPYPGPVLA